MSQDRALWNTLEDIVLWISFGSDCSEVCCINMLTPRHFAPKYI